VAHRYLNALTTPSVEAARERHGSRTSVRRLIDRWDTDGVLGEDETEFIEGRDGFYLGTVGETGWPYIQHRGGPPGFLHVLDAAPTAPEASRLAWADFRGNRQYVSVGNLGASSRVSLFLMDYARQQRLKILGTARVLDVRESAEAEELAAQLADPEYPARVERVITVTVHGYDWNCPQHITPRWTREELAPALEPLRTEIDALHGENSRLRQQIAELKEAATWSG
jgi:predicted pyridoxine 5'-phosphate oxidase superfamily flavin-nucleotide-binding protein